MTVLNKIFAGLAAFFSAVAGILGFILMGERKKTTEEIIKETRAELEREQEQRRKYMEYKKENEELRSEALAGDDINSFNAGLKLMQKHADAGKKRNSK